LGSKRKEQFAEGKKLTLGKKRKENIDGKILVSGTKVLVPMNLLSWNCCGLGNPRVVRDLCQVIKEKKPNIMFLMETKCRKVIMEMIRISWGSPVCLWWIQWDEVEV
jgi:NADPH-dependent 2,4-dienoyl-CoA reductase/sulfur reductase-like enzyme